MESKRKAKQNLMEAKVKNKNEELNKTNNSNKTDNNHNTTNNNSNNKSSVKDEDKENKTPTIYNHIIVNAEDKFLFLYTYLSKFSDKKILVLFSTAEEVQVSLLLFI